MGSINHEPRGGFFGLFLPLSALQSKDILSAQVEISGCVQPSLVYAEVPHKNQNGLGPWAF